MDHKTNVSELKEKIKKFCDDRDWEQFHNAKDLALAAIIEVGELLEHFRWKTEKEVDALFKDPQKKEQISGELADCFNFLFRLAQKYDIDISEAIDKNLEKNDKKYPVEKAKGSHKKYTEL